MFFPALDTEDTPPCWAAAPGNFARAPGWSKAGKAGPSRPITAATPQGHVIIGLLPRADTSNAWGDGGKPMYCPSLQGECDLDSTVRRQLCPSHPYHHLPTFHADLCRNYQQVERQHLNTSSRRRLCHFSFLVFNCIYFLVPCRQARCDHFLAMTLTGVPAPAPRTPTVPRPSDSRQRPR